MKCDICHDNEAVIFVHQVIMGKHADVHLCAHCAHERGVHPPGSQAEVSLQTLINEIRAAATLVQRQLDPRVCPVCGTGIFDIRTQNTVGCPECYNYFRGDIKDIMQSAGIIGQYAGSVPPRLAQFRSSLGDKKHIQEKLDECLAREDYEGAVLYRDQLNKLDRPDAGIAAPVSETALALTAAGGNA